jgi:light-regulated signal transduction histidine kinase (bacteriophytochrome)
VGSVFAHEADAGPVLDSLNATGKWEGEFFARRMDGTEFISRGLATVVRSENGEVVGYQSTNLDVTAQRQAEDELAEHKQLLEDLVRERPAELVASNRELEAFAYAVSHDLRSPLRSMDGFSQALLEDYSDKLDDEGKDFLGRIRNSAQHMGALIDNLLNLSLITRKTMRRRRVDLTGLAWKIADELKRTEPERDVQFVIAKDLEVNGDATLIRAMLQNLLGNAWKFTGKHAIARIEFGLVEQEWGSAYFVRDNGVGFDMKYADQLFGAFHRLHSTTEFCGTGIGLATVKRILTRHGGRVWADAEVVKGATFYFTL